MNWRGERLAKRDRFTLGTLLLAALVAARPRRRARWRWVTERLRAALEATGHTDATDALLAKARRDLDYLEAAGVVRVVTSGRQIVAVEVRRSAAAGLLVWKTTARRLLAGTRPTLAVEQLAAGTGMQPRTIWRWLAGETAPAPEALAAAIHTLAGDRAKEMGEVLYRAIKEDASDIGQGLFNAGLTDAEGLRAAEWIAAQFAPYIVMVTRLMEGKAK